MMMYMLLRKEQQHFLAKCLTILEKYGWEEESFVLGRTTECHKYVDEILYICRTVDGQNLEIERLRNGNRVVMVQDGRIIRFSPEYVFLEEYVNMKTEDLDVQLDRSDYPPEESAIVFY